MTGAMHGPTVILIVFGIVGCAAIGVATWIRDRDEQRRHDDLVGVAEWERTKRELAPRSIP